MGCEERQHRQVSFHDSEGSHRECAHAFDLHRQRKETEVIPRKLVQSSKVFDNGDFSSEQEGMHGSGQVADVVNVQRVDAPRAPPLIPQAFSGVPGQKRMALEY